MAGEIQFDPGPADTGLTVYAILRNTVGQVWNTAGAAFEAYNAANIADYDIALTEQGSSGFYAGNMPAVALGLYTATIKQQAGGSPAVSDTRVAGGVIDWDGTAVVPLGSRLAPTTAGRTLDVSATGEAGVDWANVGSPTATVNLSATTIKTATDVETDTADIQTRLPAALVSGRIDASVGAMAANTITAAATAADYITEVQTAITGGAYDLDTDANGRIRIVDGTGAGEINTTSGVVEARLADGVGHGGSNTTLTLNSDGTISPLTISATYFGFSNGPAVSIYRDAGAIVRIWGDSNNVGIDFTTANKAIACYGSAASDLQGAWNPAWDAEVQSECADALTAYGASTLTAAGIRTAVGLASADLDTQLDALPTAVENADALLARNAAGGSNGGKTVAFYVQGGLPKVVQNASGTSYTIYGADGTTVLSTGTIGRLATTVGGVEDVTPA